MFIRRFQQLRIFLQVSTDPYDRFTGVGCIEFTYSESQRQLPDFPFDASVSSPLSPANVRRCLEVNFLFLRSFRGATNDA